MFDGWAPIKSATSGLADFLLYCQLAPDGFVVLADASDFSPLAERGDDGQAATVLGVGSAGPEQVPQVPAVLQVELAVTDTADERTPFGGGEHQHRAVRVFAVAHGDDAGKVGGDLNAVAAVR